MSEKIKSLLDEARHTMDKSLDHLDDELVKIRAGKSSPTMLDGIVVDYYGNPTPLSQVANIGTPDARSLTVKPWEKNMLAPIEKSIMAANIGLTPMNDGETIRINIPPLTEERRKELVKRVKVVAENAKVSVRNIRRNINDSLKALQKEGVSEDDIKGAEAKVQDLTNGHINKIDKRIEAKEAEIMTI